MAAASYQPTLAADPCGGGSSGLPAAGPKGPGQGPIAAKSGGGEAARTGTPAGAANTGDADLGGGRSGPGR